MPVSLSEKDVLRIRPERYLVLVKRDTPKDQSAGGIAYPQSAVEEVPWATVVSVGPGYTMSDGCVKPLGLRKGQRVILGKMYDSVQIAVKDSATQYYLVSAENIVAILVEDEDSYHTKYDSLDDQQ